MALKRRILFFTKGAVPSAEERAAAENLGTKMFRNASMVHESGCIELCDAVAGLVPEPYARRYPSPVLDAAAVEAATRAEEARLAAEIAERREREEKAKNEQAEARVKAETDRLRAEAEARAKLELERQPEAKPDESQASDTQPGGASKARQPKK